MVLRFNFKWFCLSDGKINNKLCMTESDCIIYLFVTSG